MSTENSDSRLLLIGRFPAYSRRVQEVAGTIILRYYCLLYCISSMGKMHHISFRNRIKGGLRRTRRFFWNIAQCRDGWATLKG